jgi:hypothetical protein
MEDEMIMIGTMTFAAECAMAAAEAYSKVPPVPGFMKLIGPYIRSSIEGGISTISIYEFDEPQADAAIDYLNQRYATFSKIEGVAAHIEEWLGIDMVMQLLDETHSVTAALEAVSFRI